MGMSMWDLFLICAAGVGLVIVISIPEMLLLARDYNQYQKERARLDALTPEARRQETRDALDRQAAKYRRKRKQESNDGTA
jgi:hypothetical protein